MLRIFLCTSWLFEYFAHFFKLGYYYYFALEVYELFTCVGCLLPDVSFANAYVLPA